MTTQAYEAETFLPLLEATPSWTLEPGDHLLLRVPLFTTMEQATTMRETLRERLPDIEVTLVTADDWLVYRPGGTNDA